MNTSIVRKIEQVEPVQWAIDFLEEMLRLSGDKDVSSHYWEQLLKEKKREILEDYYHLTPGLTTRYRGVLYSEGMDAGRMLVMRILLGILPPWGLPAAYAPVKGKPLETVFNEVLIFLKSLHLESEQDCRLWKSSFQFSLDILFQRGFSSRLLYRGGQPLLIAASPYREKTGACYLFQPHVVLLYCSAECSPEKRSYLILHETGHHIYNRFFQGGRKLPRRFFQLLGRLNSPEFPGLLLSGSQGMGEVFANLFAFSMLSGTPAGEILFSHYLYRLGEGRHLLRETFNPVSLLGR